jgi:hypothetical protein
MRLAIQTNWQSLQDHLGKSFEFYQEHFPEVIASRVDSLLGCRFIVYTPKGIEELSFVELPDEEDCWAQLCHGAGVADAFYEVDEFGLLELICGDAKLHVWFPIDLAEQIPNLKETIANTKEAQGEV